MSAATARQALIAAIENVAVSRDFGTTGLRHVARIPNDKLPGPRRFEVVTSVWGSDAGIASAGIAQREATWEVRVVYPAPSTTDREHMERVIQGDMDALCDVLILPTTWIPHLDALVPGTPKLETVPGQQGETVAYIAVLPLSVLYRG